MAKTESNNNNYSAKKKQQQPIKAKSIENMNEAQLRQEIENAENLLQGKIKALKKYNGENVEVDIADVFGERKRYNTARAVQNRTLMEARATEVRKEIEEIESRLNSLNKALQQVSGTGKTIRQIKK